MKSISSAPIAPRKRAILVEGGYFMMQEQITNIVDGNLFEKVERIAKKEEPGLTKMRNITKVVQEETGDLIKAMRLTMRLVTSSNETTPKEQFQTIAEMLNNQLKKAVYLLDLSLTQSIQRLKDQEG
jgi:hypothetical protein